MRTLDDPPTWRMWLDDRGGQPGAGTLLLEPLGASGRQARSGLVRSAA